MDIILTKDIVKLGKRGSVVKVKDGYARNYLIPRKLALKATDSNKRHFEEVMRQTRARMEKQQLSAQDMKSRLDGEHIKLVLAFGETGKAYGSVTAKDIALAFREKDIYFDHHQVLLDHPLKEAGAHDVKIHLFADVEATVKVWVVPEGEAETVSADVQEVPEELKAEAPLAEDSAAVNVEHKEEAVSIENADNSNAEEVSENTEETEQVSAEEETSKEG